MPERGRGLDLGELLLDEHVGDPVRRRLALRAPVRDLEDRVEDLHRVRAGLLGVVAEDLLRDVDETARVDRVVRRVEDAARVKVVAMARLGELVVRRARDDRGTEARARLVVQVRA